MRGVSIPELLVALAIVLVVAGGLARAVSDAGAIFMAQPESSDVVQRGRVSLSAIVAELAHAGGGPYRLAGGGPLMRWIPPIHPRRLGPVRPDSEFLAVSDRVTAITVPDAAPQAMIGDMPSPSHDVPIDPATVCPPDDGTCEFRSEQQLIAFDKTTAFESLVVDRLEPGIVPRRLPLAKAYRVAEDARIAGARIITYYHDRVRRQLRRYDGNRSDVPIADDVVSLEVRYFGDPFPPDEPRPPPGSESCLFDRSGMPRLRTLPATHGTLVELTPAMLSDGEWCGVAPFRFDADLYRVRQIRIAMRFQAESAAVRGRDPRLFTNPGHAREVASQVTDLQLTTIVTPQNLRGP